MEKNEDKNIKTVSNATAWSFLGQLVIKIMPLATNMILARLFEPEVFGVVTTVTMITSFADIFCEAGFQKRIVCKNYLDSEELHKDANVAFWTNFTISITLWCLISLFSRELSTLLGQPGISKVIIVACVQLPITSVISIQTALNQRDYGFKRIFQAQLLGSITSFGVSVGLSFFGFSYWAIIIGTISNCIIRAFVLSYRSEWRPGIYYSLKRLKEMFSFSIWVLLESVAVWFSSWTDSFFVGNGLSSRNLGIYRNSQSTVNGLLAVPQYAITNVLIVKLTKDMEDPVKYNQDYLTAQKLLAFTLYPLGVGAFVYRDLAVQVVFGSGWEEARIVVGLWALVSVFRIVFISSTNAVYVSKGIPKIAFYLQIIDILILIPTCIYGVKMGFEYFVVIRCIARVVTIIPNMYFMEHFCEIRAIDIIKNNASPFLTAGIMGIFAMVIKSVTPEGIMIDFCAIFVSALVYFALVFLFARKEFLDIFNIVKSFFGKSRKG